MNRLAIVIGLAALLTLIGYAGYQGYSHYEASQEQVRALSEKVAQTAQLAEKESASAAAAKQKAEEAAKAAASEADARQHAEAVSKQSDEQRQQAEMARDQALTAAQAAKDEVDKMRQEREKELNNMQEALSKIVETRRTPNGMVMILPDSTFRFAFDSSELTEKNRELLSRIAGILLVSKGYGLAVYGYTDDVGSIEYNQLLSERRAKAVEDYLVQAGVRADIVNAKGYGKQSPIVNANTAEARAKNRRVEIAVTDSSIKYGDEAAQ